MSRRAQSEPRDGRHSGNSGSSHLTLRPYSDGPIYTNEPTEARFPFRLVDMGPGNNVSSLDQYGFVGPGDFTGTGDHDSLEALPPWPSSRRSSDFRGMETLVLPEYSLQDSFDGSTHGPDYASFLRHPPNSSERDSGYGSVNFAGRPQLRAFGDTKHESKPSSYICPSCGRTLKTRSEMTKHELQHTKPFQCFIPGCARTEGFSTKNDLQRHRKSVHGESCRGGLTKLYICQACPKPSSGSAKAWPRLDNFKAHIRRKHPEHDIYMLVQASERQSHHDSTLQERPRKPAYEFGVAPSSLAASRSSAGAYFSWSDYMLSSSTRDSGTLHISNDDTVLSPVYFDTLNAWSFEESHANSTSGAYSSYPAGTCSYPEPFKDPMYAHPLLGLPQRGPLPDPLHFASALEQKPRDEYPCHVCHSVKKRAFDLKKHMKRHTRPYGCTFSKCNKRFGSRNDWKRHETSQHFSQEMWRCDIKAESTQMACAFLARDQKEITKHLTTAHGIAPGTEESESMCSRMHLGRDGKPYFWCGFCNARIGRPEKNSSMFASDDQRSMHIADHFDKDNSKIDDWIDIEDNKRKGPAEHGQKNAELRKKGFIDDDSDLGEDGIPQLFLGSKEPVEQSFQMTNNEQVLDESHDMGKESGSGVYSPQGTTESTYTKAEIVHGCDVLGATGTPDARSHAAAPSEPGRLANVNVEIEDVDYASDLQDTANDARNHEEHVGAPTIAQTATDEGYYSTDKQKDPDITENDAQSDTDSVRTDNRDSGLAPNTKDHLSACFAQEILEDLQLAKCELATAVDDICSSLPELLREFSTLAEGQANRSLEEKACIFVRHQRHQITREFRSKMANRPDHSMVPSAKDKIDLLWMEQRSIDHDQLYNGTRDDTPPENMEYSDSNIMGDSSSDIFEDPQSDMMEDSEMDITENFCVDMEESRDDYPEIPEVPEARTFLTQSSEYRWLLGRIKTQTRTMSALRTDHSIRQQLREAMHDKRSVKLELDWHLESFLSEQYDDADAVDLAQVLCCSGLADNAYVAPCIEYVQLMWPRLGEKTVKCLSRGLREPVSNASLPEDTTVSIVTGAGTTYVTIIGPLASVIEVGEILAWVGAACRASPRQQITYCLPRIVAREDSDVCRIVYDYPDMASTTSINQQQGAKCWHQMFRNPTIAYGYPIPVRHNEEAGLEVSLPIMACLGAAPRVVDFYQMLFLKGFCSMFVPMMQIGQSIIWHFLLETDGKRISYNRGLDLQTECVGLSSPILEQSRHFVGWTPSAKILAGTREANYDIGLSSGRFSTSGLATLKNVNITAGYFVQIGANIAPGKKDTSVTVAEARDSRPYEQQMDAASEMFVNFYDTDAQKGWLLDGATALLHLTRAWFSSSYASFSAEQAVAKFTYPSVFDGRKSSLSTLNLEANRGIELYSRKQRTTEVNAPESMWCWEQLVEQKWYALEKIHDYMDRLSRTSPQLPSALRSSILEGIEFLDVLSNKATIKLKAIHMNSDTATWLDMTRDNGTINIFGSGFGNLIIPTSISEMKSSCSQQRFVPDGNDYLIVPLYVIRKIADSYDEREDGSVSLGESAYWSKPSTCITKCPCGSKKNRKCRSSLAQLKSGKVSMDQLENLLDSMGKKRKSCPKTDIFRCNPYGAVIFGNETKTPTKTPRKRKQNFDDKPSRNTRARTSDSGIDVASSGTSHDASSPSQSQSSIGDSGMSGSHSAGSN